MKNLFTYIKLGISSLLAINRIFKWILVKTVFFLVIKASLSEKYIYYKYYVKDNI